MKIKLNRFLAGALTVCFMIPQTGFAVKAETENPPSAEDAVLETIPETTEETETSEENFEIMPIRETEESGEEKILANSALSDREAVEADLAGFVVPDEFVVGYGLDYAQLYRNLPYIGVLKPVVYENA